jgi:putative heme transporter
MPAEDLTLGTIDLRALARRAALPAAAAATLVIAIVVLGGPLQAFADALGRAVDADPVWVGGAAAFELLSFGGYVMLLWLVGRRASARLGLRESAQITLGGAAATRLLPTAGAGGAALTLWALRRSGLGNRGATRTLLTFLVLMYSVFLASIVVTGTLLFVQGEPVALTALPAVLALAGIVLPLLAAWLAPEDGTGRVGTSASVVGGAVRDALGHAGSVDPRLLGAFAWWGFDLAVLWAMLHAFGSPPALSMVVLAYFLGQVGNTIPVPGAVSGGLVGALLAFGVDADLAIVSVLAYRAIAIWVPAPVGLVALSSLRRTIAAWGREDALVTPAAPEVPAVAPAAALVPGLAVPAVAAVAAAPRASEGRQPWRPASVHAAA